MNKVILNELLDKFKEENNLDKKIDILQEYDLSSLSNKQIDKILSTLSDKEMKLFISLLDKKSK